MSTILTLILLLTSTAEGPVNRLPQLTVEAIQVDGLEKTSCELVARIIGIRPGALLTPDDPRLEAARLQLLALGIFHHVEFQLKKGRRRGNVILIVRVEERQTLIIRHLFFGASRIIPFWLGLGLQEGNFLGKGMRLSVAAVGTARSDIMEGRPQYAVESSLFAPKWLPIPLHLGARYANGTEFYRTYGEADDGDPENFLSLDYQRGGFWTETFLPLGRLFLHVGLSSELLHTTLPGERIRHFPDGTSRQIHFGLQDGFSALGFLSGRLSWDTRDRENLPSSGTLLELGGRIGSPVFFSSYSYTRGELQIEHYRRLGRHIFSLHFFGGMMMGDPALFDKFYIGDLQDLVAPRALGLNLSVSPSPNFLGTGISEARWGTAAFKLSFRYDYPLFSRSGFIYRGHLFFSAGVMGLAAPAQLRFRETSLRDALPVDLTLDFGLHLDTKMGIFRLSFANALSRMPF
ncbi:BamA/TamA family outer membrane protein [Myxococcota bacterium]|nr:BamA/TamA family outer membrane protein [Myxococcota bacterium]